MSHKRELLISNNHWTCRLCNSYNDILRSHCNYCLADKPEYLSGLTQGLVEVRRDIWKNYGLDKLMTENEQLYADFYRGAAILVADMDIVQLREHRSKLVKILLEAKANTQATDDAIRDKEKKAGKKADWLVTNENISVSDSIAAVDARRKRMSKLDKMVEGWKKIGLDDATIEEMKRNVERNATEADVKAMKTIVVKEKVEDIKAVQVKPEKVEDKEPFDPSSLGF